jgi:hypothetical protein
MRGTQLIALERRELMMLPEVAVQRVKRIRLGRQEQMAKEVQRLRCRV